MLLAVMAVLLAPAKAFAARAASMAIDANTGEVLHAEAADQPRFPASLTKMMTIYLAFEAVEKGQTSFSRKIKISQEAASAAPSKLDLDPGEEIALIDAIKALITKSANDVAIAVGEHLAGSEARFAELMTQKARAIGMSQTTFKNASGLPDPAQVTTARDMVTLAIRLQDDFPKHYPMFAMRSFTYNGGSFANHNTLLGNVEGIDGIKTGYTRMSGFNLVSSIRRDGKHVVAAVFGGATAGLRNVQMRLLLNRALAKASRVKTRQQAPQLIARPKLAPRTPAAVETKVAAAPVPAERPRMKQAAAAAVVERPAPPAAEPPQMVAEPPALQSAPVEIARVRPVMVAQRVRPAGIEQSPKAVDEEIPLPPLATGLAATPPRGLPQQPALMAVATETASIVRGTPPSSLQAQAEALARGTPAVAAAPAPLLPAAAPARPFVTAQGPAPAFRLNGPLTTPAAAAVAVTGGGFQIQIGAFNSAAEADRAIATARERAAELVGKNPAAAFPAQKDNRQIYRARFSGYDARAAAGTCLELRRRQIDCFVMKAE